MRVAMAEICGRPSMPKGICCYRLGLKQYTWLYQILANLNLPSGQSERLISLLKRKTPSGTPVQLERLKCLISSFATRGSFLVVGDESQAIYSFTGSSIGNILNFSSTFEGSRIFIHKRNYRRTPQIPTACQNLIRHNLKKIEKTLVTKNRDGD